MTAGAAGDSIVRMDYRMFVVLAYAAACGPEEAVDASWMLGVYSSEEANLLGHNVNGVSHYEIRANGEFVIGGYDRCGQVELERRTYTWEYAGDGAIEVEFPEHTKRWRLTPGEDCNRLAIARFENGAFGEAYTYPRGAVCVRSEPCEPGTGECFCETYWCDEAPPACADEAS